MEIRQIFYHIKPSIVHITIGLYKKYYFELRFRKKKVNIVVLCSTDVFALFLKEPKACWVIKLIYKITGNIDWGMH